MKLNEKHRQFWSNEIGKPVDYILKNWKKYKYRTRSLLESIEKKNSNELKDLFILFNHQGNIEEFLEKEGAVLFRVVIEFCNDDVEMLYNLIFNPFSFGTYSEIKCFQLYKKVLKIYLSKNGKRVIEEYNIRILEKRLGQGIIFQFKNNLKPKQIKKVRGILKEFGQYIKKHGRNIFSNYRFDKEYEIGNKYYYLFRKGRGISSNATLAHKIKFKHMLKVDFKIIIYDTATNCIETFFQNRKEVYHLKRLINKKGPFNLDEIKDYFEIDELKIIEKILSSQEKIILSQIEFNYLPSNKLLSLELKNKNKGDITTSLSSLKRWLEGETNKLRLEHIKLLHFNTSIETPNDIIVQIEKVYFNMYKFKIKEERLGNEIVIKFKALFHKTFGFPIDTILIIGKLKKEDIICQILSRPALPLWFIETPNALIQPYTEIYQTLLDNHILINKLPLQWRRCKSCGKINNGKLGLCQCGSDPFFWDTPKVNRVPLELNTDEKLIKYTRGVLKKIDINCVTRKYSIPFVRNKVSVLFDRKDKIYFIATDKYVLQIKQFFISKQSKIVLIDFGKEIKNISESYIGKIDLSEIVIADIAEQLESFKTRIININESISQQIGTRANEAGQGAYESIREGKIPSSDYYEEATYNLLFASFYYGQLLGTQYRGKSKTDAILFFPKLAKDKGLGAIAWDCKYYTSRKFQISKEIKKQKKYIIDLKKDMEVKNRGGLYAYGIISNNVNIENFKRDYIQMLPRGWKGKVFIMDWGAQLRLYEILSTNKTQLINNIPNYKLLKRNLFRGPTCKKGVIILTKEEIDKRISKIFNMNP